MQRNQARTAQTLSIGQQARAAGQAAGGLQAINSAIIPLAVANAEVLESYGVRMVKGLLENSYMVVKGDSVVGLLTQLRQMEADGVIPWFQIEFDGLHQTTLVPNDPRYSEQFHLNGEAQSDINVIDAWDIARGSGVVVSIVDEGAEYTHPDLPAPRVRIFISISTVAMMIRCRKPCAKPWNNGCKAPWRLVIMVLACRRQPSSRRLPCDRQRICRDFRFRGYSRT